MTRRRITVAAAVLAAAVLAGNGASAQGLADLEGDWMGTVTGTVIMSDELEVEIDEVHGDHVDHGHWSMGLPPAAVAVLGHDELSGEVTGGHGMPPVLTFEVDQIEGCEVEVEVEVETIEVGRWEGHWHTHDCPINDEGEMMLMRAGAVPALPLVGVLVLAAVLARRGWRGLQDRR